MAYTISELNWALYKQYNEDYDSEEDYHLSRVADGSFEGDSTEWDELESALYASAHHGETQETKFVELEGIGQVRQVEQFGGMGDGDTQYIVISVTDEYGAVRLFKRNGWYQSFHGGEYDGPTEEVKPVDRIVTFYESI